MKLSSDMTGDEGINLFVNHFRSEIKLVSSTDFGQRDDVFKRLLFCCLIDTMSHVLRLKSHKNSQRDNKSTFLSAIQKFGRWPGHNKVSYPYLDILLSQTKKVDFKPVKKYLSGVSWPAQNIVSMSQDIDPKWLEVNWPQKNGNPVKIKTKFGKFSFSALRHDYLLYDFRNKLVHEMRATSAEDCICPDERYPYYHKGIDLTKHPNREYWALKHPPKFLENLTLNILQGLENDCRRRQIDPGPLLWTEPFWSERQKKGSRQ